jgi:RNA polymerase sigma-70 factor (ECF subfamily)
MDDAWRAAVGAARDAWPGVGVDAERFAAHAEARRREGGAAIEHLGDLYLAFAAAEGDPVALRRFDERVLSGIEPALRGVDASPTFVDEIKQLVRVRLLVGTGGEPARITAYRGGGPLGAWVRVAALRVALNEKRSQKATISPEDMIGELVSREPDPELRHLKTLYRSEFGQALRDALAALSGRDRAVLRLHYVDGLRLAHIGTLYGVQESTASRWVRKAVESVADDARRRLRERLALSGETLDSVARMVQSGLELSIGRLLQGR